MPRRSRRKGRVKPADVPARSRYTVRHQLAEAYTLGNAAVFRIIEAGVRDLQAADRGLDRRQHRPEARRADRLGVTQASDIESGHIAFAQRRVDQVEITK